MNGYEFSEREQTETSSAKGKVRDGRELALEWRLLWKKIKKTKFLLNLLIDIAAMRDFFHIDF